MMYDYGISMMTGKCLAGMPCVFAYMHKTGMIASRRRMTERGSDLDRSGCTMIERIRLVSTVSLYRLLMIDPGPRRGSDLV